VKGMKIMSLIEKRDFIHSRLHQADESIINEFYEILHKKEALKTKLTNRAHKSENDIKSGKIFSRAEIEHKMNNAIRQ
jgi:RNA polymerase-interacting CarD/CdnL/TRCF family regulator